MRNRPTTISKQKVINFGVTNGLIELSAEERNSKQIVANKYISTLLYESKRHEWNAPQCVAMRKIIVTLVPTLENKSISDYERYIVAKERTKHDYFGSYLSDDSDSEEEQTFQKMDEEEKKAQLAEGRQYQEWGQAHKLTYKNKSQQAAAGALKINHAPSALFDLSARVTIHHSNHVDLVKAKRDLNYLNLLLKKQGYTIEKAIAELTADAKGRGEQFTNFFVSEYRGVTHTINKWNKPSRVAHRRDPDEIGQRQCSSSVYKAANINFFRNYPEAKKLREENPALLNDPAEELREILLTFREPRPYSYGGYTYSNLAYLLQNIYTETYDQFHKLIKTDATLKSILLNDLNPFFSMGDTPYHANKYAYGLKSYAGHEGDRLRPRWRKNGKAERPYSGVVYVSLHPLTDYTSDGPLHLITLNRNAEIKLKSELVIIAERESCFPAYLPEGRITYKHIAKYPSFRGDYKQIYAYKYGLTKALYNKFKEGFATHAPHAEKRLALENLLGEWLCSFYEAKLLDTARQKAEAKNGVLIYRDINGGFSSKPPIDSVNRNTTAITEAIKTPVKTKQKCRADLAIHKEGIQPLLATGAIKAVLKDTDGYESDTESVSVTQEGNHTMSLPLSLMLNAIKNERYRALKRFLSIPLFQAAANETFNTEELESATLLDLAMMREDYTAIGLLSGENDEQTVIPRATI